MKLPEYNEDTRRIGHEPIASKIVNHIKWYIIIGFFLFCIYFGFEVGKSIGNILGNEITIVNDENNSKRIEIIPIK